MDAYKIIFKLCFNLYKGFTNFKSFQNFMENNFPDALYLE